MPSYAAATTVPVRENRAGAWHLHGTLAAIEARWRSLWTDCRGYAFQSFDWLSIWQRTLGEPLGWTPCIVEWRDPDGRTLALWPLGRRREGPLQVLSFLGGDVTDYHAPLLHPAFAAALSPADAPHVWNDMLRQCPRIDIVRVRRMPVQFADGSTNPFARLPGAASHESAHAALLPADIGAFRAARAAALFADTRRQMRRLSERGTLRIEPVVPAGDQARVWQALVAQKSRRWRDTGAPDGFAHPELVDFYQRLTDGPLQDMQAVLSALYLDDRPIATHWGLRCGNRFYWLMPAYDADWSRYSPGRLLMESVIGHCIDAGLAVFDLTVGDEPYKLQWADTHMPMVDLLQARSLPGRMAVQLTRLRARARDVPALRKGVQWIKGWRNRRG